MNREIRDNSLRFGSLSVPEILLFLIWPFVSLIFALKQYQSPKAMTFFWLFCVYSGFSFVIPENIRGAADSARYATKLQELHAEPIFFNQFTEMFYSAETGVADIYEPLVTWLVSLFTGNANILFAVFGAVFGFFYAKNTWLILSHVNKINSVFLLLFIIAFVLVNPIWNINGVRMWTAAQIFIYGTLNIFLEGKKSGWLWVVMSVFVHFSFVFPVVLLLLFTFMPVNIALLFIFYFATSIVSELDLKSVKNLLSFLPDFLQNRVNSYTDKDYISAVEANKLTKGWHVVFAGKALVWAKYLGIILLFFYRKQWIEDNARIKKIFALALFIGGVANITSLIPSGGRFMLLANVLFFALFVLLFSKEYFKEFKILRAVTVPLLAFSILFNIRMGFDYMGFTTIFGNPLISLFVKEQIPLIDFVKWFF